MTKMIALAPRHLADAARLHAKSFAQGWDEKALAGLLATPGAFGWCAGEGPVQGFILLRQAADEAELLTLCVDPDARRQGLGRALTAAAAAESLRRGAGRIFLEVEEGNDEAVRLYRALGFRTVGRRQGYYRGADARVMAMDLPAASQR